MNSFFYHVSVVLLPLIVSNVLHMLIVKKDLFKWLNRSISKKTFGANKTWRGFVFVSSINAFALYAIDHTFHLEVENTFYLGFLLGLVYMMFELPNSFIKRKLGVASGEQASSNKMLFSSIDKMDSAFGVNLIYFSLGYLNWKYAVILFISSSLTHYSISKILVYFKLKKSF